MANDLSSRQWRLDTPLAYGNTGAILWPSNIWVRQVAWEGYVASATAVLKDRNGKVVWSPTAAGDLSPIRANDMGWVEGLVLDTLTSGLVTLYIK
jgi:hypothetical protein